MEQKRMIYEYLCKGYTKKQILSVVPNLTSNQLDYIMRKNKWKVSKRIKAYAIYNGRSQYVKNNIIVRNDKNYKDCPFIGVSIHHKSKFSKKTVYVTAITHGKKRYKKASIDIYKVLEYRDNFYKQNHDDKFSMIKKKEFFWFIKHPCNKFFLKYVWYKIKQILKNKA